MLERGGGGSPVTLSGGVKTQVRSAPAPSFQRREMPRTRPGEPFPRRRATDARGAAGPHARRRRALLSHDHRVLTGADAATDELRGPAPRRAAHTGLRPRGAAPARRADGRRGLRGPRRLQTPGALAGGWPRAGTGGRGAPRRRGRAQAITARGQRAAAHRHDFAAHYGFKPFACKVADPDRDPRSRLAKGPSATPEVPPRGDRAPATAPRLDPSSGTCYRVADPRREAPDGAHSTGARQCLRQARTG